MSSGDLCGRVQIRHGGDRRVPARSGGLGPRPRPLCDDRRAEGRRFHRLRPTGDAVVHRSDLGLTAYTTHDGIDVFVRSLASAVRAAASRCVCSRGRRGACSPPDRPQWFYPFRGGLARGEGGVAPAAIVASEKGDYAFLSLKSPAFDLSDRGVAGRAVPAGLDAFVYTERGVYRSGETVAVTTLLRDARGAAAPNVSLTLVITRPDGVEYRRALVADQGLGGRSMSVPLVSSASTGTWRGAAYTDPKRPAVGEAAFMVEAVCPTVLIDLSSAARNVAVRRLHEVGVDGTLCLRRACLKPRAVR